MKKVVADTKAKGPSQRQLRMAEQIRHIISEALRSGHFRDPVLQNAGHITITSVDISPDMKNANTYIIPLGGKNSAEIITAMNKAAGFFRLALGQKLEIRHTPKVTFKLDKSFDVASHIGGIIIRERQRTKSSSTEEE